MTIPSPGLSEQPACFERGQQGEEGRGGGRRLWKRQDDNKILFSQKDLFWKFKMRKVDSWFLNLDTHL